MMFFFLLLERNHFKYEFLFLYIQELFSIKNVPFIHNQNAVMQQLVGGNIDGEYELLIIAILFEAIFISLPEIS